MENELIKEVKLEDLDDSYQLLAKAIGIEPLIRLAGVAGGTVLYIPKAESLLQHARDRRIIQEFNGYNYKELAVKYNLSETWVRQLIQQDQMAKDQLKLFGEVVNI